MHALSLPQPLGCPYQEAIGRAADALLNAQRSEDAQAIEAAQLRLLQRQREASHCLQALMREEYERISHEERRMQRATQSLLLTA